MTTDAFDTMMAIEAIGDILSNQATAYRHLASMASKSNESDIATALGSVADMFESFAAAAVTNDKKDIASFVYGILAVGWVYGKDGIATAMLHVLQKRMQGDGI